jgi:hypothetical protein
VGAYSSCDVTLSNQSCAPRFIGGDGSGFATSNFKLVLVVNLSNGCSEGVADNKLIVIQFVFLYCVYIGFLVSLISADLLDLVFDGVNRDMVVIVAGDACGIERFWVGYGIATKFVDLRERRVGICWRWRVEEREKAMGGRYCV